MDPRDPTQPASIFRTPDLTDDDVHAPTRVPTPPLPDRAFAREPLRPHLAEPTGPSRRLMVGVGAGALVILVIGGFVAASILRQGGDPVLAAASPSAMPSHSATITPATSPSPTVAPTATPSPIPTPVPTPAGPLQGLGVGTWATVSAAELNVRSAADANAASNYLLVQGAVVHVAEGPTSSGGLNWYRIASLGGAVGWVASGWEADPFLTTLVDDSNLIRCGEIERSVFDIVNGAPVPHDPLTVGDLALPVAAFSDFSLGTMELLRGVGQEACFSAQVDAAGTPTISAQLNVSACGRTVRDGGFFRLRPAVGQNVHPDAQVKDPVVVHPTLLTSPLADDPMSANLRTVMHLIAERADTTGCLYANVQEDGDTVNHSASVDTAQCFLVYEHANDGITLGAAAGGDTKRLLTSEGSPPPFTWALNVPVFLQVTANSSTQSASYGYVWQGYDPTCA
jgi:hypothetical protein